MHMEIDDRLKVEMKVIESHLPVNLTFFSRFLSFSFPFSIQLLLSSSSLRIDAAVH